MVDRETRSACPRPVRRLTPGAPHGRLSTLGFSLPPGAVFRGSRNDQVRGLAEGHGNGDPEIFGNDTERNENEPGEETENDDHRGPALNRDLMLEAPPRLDDADEASENDRQPTDHGDET